MGRYVAFGIACDITVCKKERVSNEEFGSLKGQIKEKIDKCIDTKHYKFTENENCMNYMIDSEFVNEHIHKFIKEVDNIISTKRRFLENLDINDDDIISDNFNMENYPFKLKYFTEKDEYKSEFDKANRCNRYGIELKENDSFKLEDSPFFTENYWMVSERSEIVNTKIHTSYITLWIDMNKIDGEDETFIIRIMNKLSKSYFKNPLGKCSHFYIFG